MTSNMYEVFVKNQPKTKLSLTMLAYHLTWVINKQRKQRLKYENARDCPGGINQPQGITKMKHR